MTSDPGWSPRLVALDVDGTVLSREGELTDRTLAAVRRVVESGIQVVLATGRTFRSTKPVWDDLGLPGGHAVTQNGAVCVAYDPRSGTHEEFGRVVFDPEPAATAALAMNPGLALAVDRDGGYVVNRPFPEGDLVGPVTVAPLEDLIAEPVTRLIVRDEAGTEEGIDALASKLGLHDVQYYVGYTAWLDICPKGVSKAAGLAQVCARAGIEAVDVLAIGDGRNDVEMFAWAGRGVAMGDAPAEVLEVADAITGSYADGGLVAELDRWFGR